MTICLKLFSWNERVKPKTNIHLFYNVFTIIKGSAFHIISICFGSKLSKNSI